MKCGLSLLLVTEPRKKKRLPIKPASVFKSCPVCACSTLIFVAHDVQCVACDWNTFRLSVDSGELDRPVAAARRSTTLEIRMSETPPMRIEKMPKTVVRKKNVKSLHEQNRDAIVA
jgi:hypothetical protein